MPDFRNVRNGELRSPADMTVISLAQYHRASRRRANDRQDLCPRHQMQKLLKLCIILSEQVQLFNDEDEEAAHQFLMHTEEKVMKNHECLYHR
jgi:hypothetical protein